MKKKYDIIVIGAGSGGLGVALGMKTFGFDVLMIEKEESNFGGECLNSGCVPSKALLHVADLLQKSKDAESYGLRSSGDLDFKKVMNYVHQRQGVIREHESAEYLRDKEGIAIEIGTASFSGKRSVSVNGKEFSAKKILVATGSKPRMVAADGIDEVKVLTNENLFLLESLPENLLVIGGGPIGIEMSQAFARMGSKIIVLEMSDRILGKEPMEASHILQQKLEQEGISFLLNHELVAFENGNRAVLKDQEGQEKKVTLDAVLVGVGRSISYDGLQLEKAGIKMRDGQPQMTHTCEPKAIKILYLLVMQPEICCLATRLNCIPLYYSPTSLSPGRSKRNSILIVLLVHLY
ncbi:MAG: FAD-dependent oxidoreductase [Owenweeksia sp.]|nr:FAD-dependent oxidoreductase [Owenweeksia sp.]